MASEPVENSLSALDVSSSGLTAQRTRMRVIASNIANANSMVTAEGGPYRRREVTFKTVMTGALDGDDLKDGKIDGIVVASVVQSKEPLKMVYDPQHLMANKQGYKSMPNINITKEMVDMISAQRAYEANLSAMTVYRNMLKKSLAILNK